MSITLNDWNYPYMARADYMLGRLPIVVSNNLPKEHIGDEIIPRHYIIRLLARWAPKPLRPSAFRKGEPIEDDKIVWAAGKVFVSPATWERLCQDYGGRK